MSGYYKLLGDYNEGIALCKEAYQKSVEIQSDVNYRATFLDNIASLYSLKGEYIEANSYLNQALQLRIDNFKPSNFNIIKTKTKVWNTGWMINHSGPKMVCLNSLTKSLRTNNNTKSL